jgi:hypothetical protein
MERVALVLVDSGITAVSSRGRVSVPSPGLALIDLDATLLGTDAQRNARLKPKRVHSRFWQGLDTTPLERPFPHHLRTADLAHAHLSEIRRFAGFEAEEVIFVVPGVYTADQLALLLGIAGAADIPVRGLVDLAVAAAADRALRRRCLHLDLHLHRAVLTEIEHGSELVRGRVWEDEGVGLLGLHDLWARTVARLFIRQTRFDPLHLAASEQSLYLELPRHIFELSERETTRITIASSGRQHTVDLERREVTEATAEVAERLSAWVHEHAGPEATTVLVSHHLASVAGLVDRLRANTDLEVAVLHPAAAGGAALGHAERIVSGGGALLYVTHLPGYDARPPGPVTVAVTPPPGKGPLFVTPTHLVVDGAAQPITETPIVITTGDAGRQASIRRQGARVVVEAPPGVTVVVNGHQVESSAALAAGDRLLLGEPPREILLVTMVE